MDDLIVVAQTGLRTAKNSLFERWSAGDHSAAPRHRLTVARRIFPANET